MQPIYVDPVDPFHMAHGGELSGLDNPSGGLVVFEELHLGHTTQNGLPQVQRGDPDRPHSSVGRDDLRFRRRVTLRCLLLRHRSQREEGARAKPAGFPRYFSCPLDPQHGQRR